MKNDIIISDRTVRIGVEFEFLISKVSEKHSKKIQKWTAISVAYYEYDIYEEQLTKYYEGKRRKLPKLPRYAELLGFVPGDDIPDPDEVMKKPKDTFLELVDDYLNINELPIKDFVATTSVHFKDRTKWIVKPDYSLSKEGFEIVSPILTLKEFVEIVPQVFKYIEKYGKTDKSCGLHISMSLKNMANKNVDTVKLASFIDESIIYKYFPQRKRTDYAHSAHKTLRDNYNEKKGKTKLDRGHWEAINIQHLSTRNKYIEFRYMGGKDYHLKWKDIKKILYMFVNALKISCTDKSKIEYKKRLNNIINNNKEK
jgi:hypothetical protein